MTTSELRTSVTELRIVRQYIKERAYGTRISKNDAYFLFWPIDRPEHEATIHWMSHQISVLPLEFIYLNLALTYPFSRFMRNTSAKRQQTHSLPPLADPEFFPDLDKAIQAFLLEQEYRGT